MHIKGKHIKNNMIFIIIPIALFFGTLFAGRFPVTITEVINALLWKVNLNYQEVPKQVLTIILEIRLPRAIAGVFVGAALAASGAAFQGVFKNPLVNSGMLGVSSGAGFGAALAILIFGNLIYVYISAFLFGIVAVMMCYSIAKIYKTTPTIMLILAGTIVTSLFGALTSLIKYSADPYNELPAIVFWLMGSLASVGFSQLYALIPIIIGLILLLIMAWRINVLSMGDKEAQTMGIEVKRDKKIIILGATLATAGAVCIAGTIGWIGLIIPHVGRMLVGNDNRRLIPASISLGASFMIIIDTLSRVITASEIPLDILTSLIGAPFFVYLLKKTKGGGW